MSDPTLEGVARAVNPSESQTEEWRSVQGSPGYEVSSLGRVRSRRCILQPTSTGRGYLAVSIKVHGGRKTCPVHRLVGTAFLGPRPDGMVTRHIDGNKQNNAARNLAYGTPTDNVIDMAYHGGLAHGDRIPKSKLTESQVKEILATAPKHWMGTGWTVEAARRYGVCSLTIRRVLQGKSWCHAVSPPCARPASDWHEDVGPVTWWRFPVQEPAWIGTPLDEEWPGDGYYTHWTPHPSVPALRPARMKSLGDRNPEAGDLLLQREDDAKRARERGLVICGVPKRCPQCDGNSAYGCGTAVWQNRMVCLDCGAEWSQ